MLLRLSLIKKPIFNFRLKAVMATSPVSVSHGFIYCLYRFIIHWIYCNLVTVNPNTINSKRLDLMTWTFYIINSLCHPFCMMWMGHNACWQLIHTSRPFPRPATRSKHSRLPNTFSHTRQKKETFVHCEVVYTNPSVFRGDFSWI